MSLIKELLKHRLATASLIIILFLAILAVFAPYIAPYDPLEINVDNILQPPSLAHPLGTDLLGRDVLSRMIYASRISLEVSLVAVGLSLMIGVVLGAIAGYFGGLIDLIICRFIDIMLCFPTIFLVLAMVAYLEPSIVTIMVVIGATSWMGLARLVRAEILSLKERDFVLIAKTYGASSLRILFKHLIPNALPPILVSASLGLGQAILIESALSFLGIGVQPPIPSWGNMLIDGKETLEVAWWLSFYPGMAILITVLAFTILGETLQEILNPKRKER
ncbi:ABC transporter permease [Thermodesulfobacterium sp.]|jgi:peptide/nickel transport system permease protein|uniref:ABC transporter permease n=1 Tax=Thermodesulfobacterium sp. TaxID=1965289 RepID=UPI0025798C8A|nr:ABC transporter permease [Thermodesulfobacterium sp.]MBZ4682382.1 peptide transporter permease [Thermodesulfobacterium sp.]MDN5379727.1 peptide/nickel transport system permease protein [Thermodesulfobacterium sp.]